MAQFNYHRQDLFDRVLHTKHPECNKRTDDGATLKRTITFPPELKRAGLLSLKEDEQIGFYNCEPSVSHYIRSSFNAVPTFSHIFLDEACLERLGVREMLKDIQKEMLKKDGSGKSLWEMEIKKERDNDGEGKRGCGYTTGS